MGSTAQFKEFGPFYYNGQLVQSPRIYHYGAGTTVLLNAYSDRAKTTAAAQPLVGNSAGLVKAYFDGVYKLEIRLSDNATVVDTWDNVDLTEGIHTIRGSALIVGTTIADNDIYETSSIPLVGCAIGDFALGSASSTSIGNGLVVDVVAATDSVRLTILNQTGASVILSEDTWNFIVFKN